MTAQIDTTKSIAVNQRAETPAEAYARFCEEREARWAADPELRIIDTYEPDPADYDYDDNEV